MPTYNGERFIREALDSLLAQDYPNFEILISDNASTDGTSDILREVAAGDSRVRVVRQPVNVGAPANFNFVFTETTGPYFMWAADDDRWEPGYVRACVEALESRPDAVLACTRVRFIDETGGPGFIDGSMDDNPDLSSRSVFRRFRLLLSRGAWYQIYGLIRRGTLRGTRLAGTAYGTDVVLLAELILRGPCLLVPDFLFRYRLFPHRAEHDRGSWHESITDRARVQTAPYTYLQEAISEAIWATPVRASSKFCAWTGVMVAFYLDKTPLRPIVDQECRIRRRSALVDRDLKGIVKYTILVAALRLRDRRRRQSRSGPLPGG